MAQTTPARLEGATEIKRVALEEFSELGYAGTSLQHIGDKAGYSKSSVLYHFASKEALLEAVIAPAVDRLDILLADSIDRVSSPELREAFVEEFIDFLLDFRLQAHIVINQGQSLSDIPIVERARLSITCLGESFMSSLPTTLQRVRLGVALAGAAYVLVAGPMGIDELEPVDEVRDALIAIVSELVRPLADGALAGASLAGNPSPTID
jgi:TetR/AcrR family transcriptional regulator